MLHSDGEHSLRAIVAATVAWLATPGVSIRNGPVLSHASQGHVERQIRTLKSQIRALTLHMSSLLKRPILAIDPINPSLVTHSAWLLCRYSVQSHDGRTAYERSVGRRYKGDIARFLARGIGKLQDERGSRQGGEKGCSLAKRVILTKRSCLVSAVFLLVVPSMSYPMEICRIS